VNSEFFQVDQQGNLVIPAEVAARYGIKPGARLRFEEGPNSILLQRPVTHLAHVYVEPTTLCNLECQICIRRAWNEPPGRMSEVTFGRILEGLRSFRPVPQVFFGGFGEPLTHPDIFRMIREVKALGAVVELITNGTLLDDGSVQALLESELDTLWVSIDGATEACYAEIRTGAELDGVLRNVVNLQQFKRRLSRKAPQIGLSFVAMEGNVREFPELLRWGLRHRIKKFSVSNVLPHTAELKGRTLYKRSLGNFFLSTEVQLPRFDVEADTMKLLEAVWREDCLPRFEEQASERRRDSCPFVARGSTSIRWDGSLSPCLPLLHSHQSFLGERQRRIEAFSVGSITDRELKELWEDPGYVSLRTRLLEFDFSPCSWCNSCDFPDSNREDCFGSPVPACGGCLWAQGFIRCP
jgi:MoaA/NifB/PqqE/SkfB family radical SAM enzyme